MVVVDAFATNCGCRAFASSAQSIQCTLKFAYDFYVCLVMFWLVRFTVCVRVMHMLDRRRCITSGVLPGRKIRYSLAGMTGKLCTYISDGSIYYYIYVLVLGVGWGLRASLSRLHSPGMIQFLICRWLTQPELLGLECPKSNDLQFIDARIRMARNAISATGYKNNILLYYL